MEADGRLPSALVPRCRLCGADAVPNVRAGNWFLDSPQSEQRARFEKWIRKVQVSEHGKGEESSPEFVIVEVGAGYNTPGVTRHMMERLVGSHSSAALIRINPLHPDTPEELKGKAVSIKAGWEELLKIKEAMNDK